MEHRYAYILRIWQHPPAAAGATAAGHDPELGELRGTLQAFDSTQVAHFNSLRDLHALLHDLLSRDRGDASSAADNPPPTA